MARIPLIVKNRLIEQIDMLQNNIEACDFPAEMREGLYTIALQKIKDWREGNLDTDEFLEETFVRKGNEVYIAYRVINKDLQEIEFERNKDKIQQLKSKLDQIDIDGEGFKSES